jgi:hypothetical protein
MRLIQIAVMTPFEGIGERIAMGLSAFAKKHQNIRLNLFPLAQGAHTFEVMLMDKMERSLWTFATRFPHQTFTRSFRMFLYWGNHPPLHRGS